jgi:MFS transporter, FSR family, fosmidomycin resistance protein
MLAKSNIWNRARSNGAWFVMVLYAVEFLDEFIYGMHSAVMPVLRNDLNLTYTQIGLLVTVPGLVAIFVEPVIGLLGDTRYRRAMVVGGIIATTMSLLLVAGSSTYLFILGAFIIMASASGAYVNLAQATLIDRNPDRAEHTMSRWVVLGSVGVTVSPLLATLFFYLGYGWRGLYLGLAAVAGLYVALLFRVKFNAHAGADDESVAPGKLLQMLLEGFRNKELMRWVLITELADLMLDKLLEVTGLYFHDVVGVSIPAASGAVAWSSIVGLVAAIALVPLIERVSGLKLLRWSAVIVLFAYVAFLLVPVVWMKYALIGLISLCTAAWFPVLRAKSYQAMTGQSGVVTAVSAMVNASSLFVPTVLGGLADAFGLRWAMWLLVLGPLSLIMGLPAQQHGHKNAEHNVLSDS